MSTQAISNTEAAEITTPAATPVAGIISDSTTSDHEVEVATESKNDGKEGKNDFKPLEPDAFAWITQREEFGGVSPSMWIPIYNTPLGNDRYLFGCEEIAFVLGRSLTLEEVKLLVSKDGEECTCGNPTCAKKFVPVKWYRITHDLLCKLAESKDLAKTLEENKGFEQGCHYIFKEKEMNFCGSPYHLVKGVGMQISYNCNAKAREKNIRQGQGEGQPVKKLWGMTREKLEEIQDRFRVLEEKKRTEDSFFDTLGKEFENPRGNKNHGHDNRDRSKGRWRS
ncbi:MAG: hypothetical protein Q7R78_02120 [bacterium]|nr:hypothetical protein [bacterium]